jgi:uncharacterized protein
MKPLDLVARVRAMGSDDDNPSPEALIDLIDSIRTVAVVGLSRDPKKAARRVPSFMATRGYDVVPVNPLADRILGRPSFATLDDVTEALDMVMVFRPSSAAGAIMTQAASRKERPIIWLQEGIRDDAVAAALRSDGFTVVQDLCFFRVHRAAHGN